MTLARRDLCLGALASLGCSTVRRSAAPRVAREDARTLHAQSPAVVLSPAAGDPPVGERLVLSEDEWRRRLSPARFEILRRQGTEPAFTGAYWNNHAAGTYRCSGCNAPLFASTDKFDSGTGWPSFVRPIAEGRVAQTQDASHGMSRNEVHCARCDGHLGHVFDDGPPPTGLRYCIDSLSLDFRPP